MGNGVAPSISGMRNPQRNEAMQLTPKALTHSFPLPRLRPSGFAIYVGRPRALPFKAADFTLPASASIMIPLVVALHSSMIVFH
jgi:hypothetical protein